MSVSGAVQASTVGVAGRCGKDVRSDCRVEVEILHSGGIEISLRSRVEPYYGEAIRAQVLEVLQALGARSVRVSIEDEGALPYVIAARVEAAYRSCVGKSERRFLPGEKPEHAQSSRSRLRRSRLYLPGSEPKYFVNAGLHAPDAIILDLEDSVHPEEKAASRLLVRNALRAVDFGAAERMVRVNQLPLGLDDLEEVIPEEPDVVLIPKTETGKQVIEVDHRITDIERKYGITRKIWLMPILESALGIEHAFAIAGASDRVVALTIGLEDYTADLGVVKTATGEESLYARTRLVNAARAAGIQAIDSVFGDVGNLGALREWGTRSRALGFEGMGCVHPMQIPVIHEAFAPTPAEIDKALKIVAAFDEAQEQKKAVVSLGSKMIDPPVVQRSLALVERARLMGLIPSVQANGSPK